MSLADEGMRLIGALEEELARKPRARETRASDAELRAAVERVREMIGAIDGAATDTWPVLGRMVVESWSPTASLSQQVVAFEELYQRTLAQRSRRGRDS